VAFVVEIFEGPFALAECFNGERITCPQWDGCLIRSPFSELNHKIYQLLSETTVADLARKPLEASLEEKMA
jgi:DNA-binding IscR family transcriptional regulator